MADRADTHGAEAGAGKEGTKPGRWPEAVAPAAAPAGPEERAAAARKAAETQSPRALAEYLRLRRGRRL